MKGLITIILAIVLVLALMNAAVAFVVLPWKVALNNGWANCMIVLFTNLGAACLCVGSLRQLGKK